VEQHPRRHDSGAREPRLAGVSLPGAIGSRPRGGQPSERGHGWKGRSADQRERAFDPASAAAGFAAPFLHPCPPGNGPNARSDGPTERSEMENDRSETISDPSAAATERSEMTIERSETVSDPSIAAIDPSKITPDRSEMVSDRSDGPIERGEMSKNRHLCSKTLVFAVFEAFLASEAGGAAPQESSCAI
jgi:hypothetical protein